MAGHWQEGLRGSPDNSWCALNIIQDAPQAQLKAQSPNMVNFAQDTMHERLQQASYLFTSKCITPSSMQNLEHPELIITWASDFPDKLKIRKEVTIWPLRFKLRADYTRALRSFEYGCSCKVGAAHLKSVLGQGMHRCTAVPAAI